MLSIAIPQFKSYFRVEIVKSESIWLLSERETFVLSDRLSLLVAPLINGDRTVDEIIDFLEKKVAPAEIYYALALMEQKGYIVESDRSIPSDIAAFWELCKVAPQQATKRSQSLQVAVTAIGAISAEPLIDILKSLDIQIGDRADIEIVLTDDYLREELAEINRKALAAKQPWAIAKPVGTILWIGPIFHPGKTGCWECLAHRLRTNRPFENYIQKYQSISTFLPTSFAKLPSTLNIGLNLLATEIAKWIVRGENKSLEGIITTFDSLSLKTQDHILTKRPQCPCCGQLEPADFIRPIQLESRYKTVASDGGYRCVLPEETLKKYECHVSPITGVVSALNPVSPTENSLVRTYSAGHNFATLFDSLEVGRESIRGKSGGKGKTEIQAKASALCEAIERYSGVFQGDEIRQKAAYKDMEEAAIHPNDCMNFSQKQYQTRQEWNATCPSFFQRVPEPFNEERELEWTPVWSLTNRQVKYLPTAYCYYGYPRQQNPYCWANSNGCAAGNNLEEAILQGFLELVERDSVALWWYNRIKRPGVDLASFDEPYFRALKEYYRSLDRDLWVLDITGDFGIPAFVAISALTNREIEDIIFAFGAHFDPKIALLRSLTEINQILPGVVGIAPDRSTQYRFPDELAIQWWKTATLANQPYLVADAIAPLKVYSDYPQMGCDDLREEVMNCVKIAEKNGLETLVLDQTRPDIGLNVVKVIVPGMRHFWKRLGAGRLYDVPVKLGWLPEPLQESQLNPFPMFL